MSWFQSVGTIEADAEALHQSGENIWAEVGVGVLCEGCGPAEG